MWTANCPYFGTTITGNDKSKLLKCGQTYPVGRKEAKILIHEPWVSRAQGSFTVGPYAEGDVYDMDKVPTLEFKGGKSFWFLREGETIVLEAGAVGALKNGDQLVLHKKMMDNPLTVQWIPVVCLVEDIQTISAKDCAKMGVKVAMEYHPSITHHVADQITGEPNQLPALLRGGCIVTRRWAQELVHRLRLPANLPDSDMANLEDNCLLPHVVDYLPTFSPNLTGAWKQPGLWASNEARIGMFQGRHFLFLVEGAIVANAWKDVILAGEGTYETFDIHQGISVWSNQLTLSRGRAAEQGTTLVLVANEEALDAAVGAGWKNFIRETERIGLRFLPYDKITEAVLLASKELLKSEFDPGQATSQLPTQIPGSLQDEASSLEPTQTVVRRRRAPSTAVESIRSASELPPSQDEDIPNRSQLLRRRVREPSSEPLVDPSRPIDRTLLRRRNPTQVSQIGQTSRDESVLDKHRKLFEETDPERQLGSQSQAQGSSTQARSLMDMVEEADRQRLEALDKVTSNSRKRKAQEVVEDDPENDDGDGMGTSKPASRASSRSRSIEPPSKKRTLKRSVPANLDVVAEDEEPPPTNPSGSSKSAKKASKVKGSTQLDKDDSFLVALASMKKGKKKEEQTDRDFNSLKISKPIINNDDAEIDMLAWELLPKDMDIRGNFMVCVENVTVREGTQSKRRKDGKLEWVGRPDFKKFRKKVPKKRTAIVELVANLSLDAVDEEEVIEAEPDEDFDMPHIETKGKGIARPTRTQVTAVSDSELEESQEVEGFSGRTAVPARSGRARTQQRQPLFLPDSDQEVERAVSVEQSDQEEPQTRGSGKTITGTKRKAVVLAASSSEDEAYDKRRKKRSNYLRPMSVEDGKSLEEKRAELIASHELKMRVLIEERKALARHVYIMTKIPGSLLRLPSLNAVSDEQFQLHMDAHPMTIDECVSFGPYNHANLPTDEFLLGPSRSLRNRSNSNIIIPSVHVQPYSDDSQDEDEQMDVEFSSKYPLKINWTKASRDDQRNSRPPLFSSNYASALPIPPPHFLRDDFSGETEFAPTSQKDHGSSKENKPPKPIDFNRWQATLTHNPAYKLVRKASKCLTTNDWNTSIQELVLFRAFERIDELRNANQWSFRQPKRQVIEQVKDHWSYLLDEAKWMQADFREEKKWKMTLAFELAQAVAEWHLASPEERMNLRGYYRAPEFPEPAEPIERGVPQEEKEEEDLPEKPEIAQDTEGDSSEEDEVQAVISKESDKEVQAMEVVPTEPVFTMKTEETDQANMANLVNPEDDDRKPNMSQERELDDSKNPIMFISNSDTKDTVEKIAQDFREVEGLITKLDSSSLWVDPTELEALVHPPKEEEPSAVNFEWDKLLPDLPVYSMDAPPDIPKGVETLCKDEVQSETIPISRFADSQPLLLGALQPALRLQDGVWQTFDQTPVSAKEGKRPTPLSSRTVEKSYLITSPKTTNKITASKAPLSASWSPSDDKLLKKLVDEYGFHWRLIAETFNFYRRSNSMELRTPSHCYVRYDLKWGDHSHVAEGDVSMDGVLGDSPIRMMDLRYANTPTGAFRKPRAPEEFVPTVTQGEDDAKFMRHKFVHRAIKRVMKRREEEAKARDVPHRMMVPHQSHDAIMKTKFYTPLELGKMKRDAEEKRLIEMQKRRQIDLRHAHEAARIRLLQAQGHQPSIHGAMPNGIPNPMAGMNGNQQINGSIPITMRAAALPNISQQQGAMMAQVQRGAANGEMNASMQSAMIILQQQNQQRLAAAAMANSSPPRPQSAASILSQGAMGGGQPQAAMLARQHAMQDPNFRAQMQANAMAQMSQAQLAQGISSEAMAMFRHQQMQAQAAQSRALAQQMAAGAAMQQQQQQQQQNQNQL